MLHRILFQFALLFVGGLAVPDDDSESCGCAASRSDATAAGIDPSPAGIVASAGLDPSGAATFSFDDALRARVPAGTNSLGTDAPFFPQDGEGPAYSVTFATDYWIDAFEVTNRRFAEFIAATGFKTDAESYGWSFVHELAVPKETLDTITKAVKDLEWWLPV